MSNRTHITEADAERIIDRRVMKALSTSHSYRDAENAEEQAEAEQRLTREIERDVYREYVVGDHCGHGLPISGPTGEFVQCDACDAGNAEADLLR